MLRLGRTSQHIMLAASEEHRLVYVYALLFHLQRLFNIVVPNCTCKRT